MPHGWCTFHATLKKYYSGYFANYAINKNFRGGLGGALEIKYADTQPGTLEFMFDGRKWQASDKGPCRKSKIEIY